jgi:hypothetical protein
VWERRDFGWFIHSYRYVPEQLVRVITRSDGQDVPVYASPRYERVATKQASKKEIRILKEHSKTEVARVIPFEEGSRLEKLLRRRAFLGPDAYVFDETTTGEYVAGLKSAWETLLLLANGITPTRAGSGKRVSNRKELAKIDLHWHDLRHEALSRLADDGVPVHELQLLAGHANITTTQRYMNARASSLAESMRQARARRARFDEGDNDAIARIG